ncbi:MAG: transcriptional regulator [Varibaculum sp.]|nr:transcriptional regulator [Varibaculum sp.]
MIKYLSLAGLARRVGITPTTARKYQSEHRLPEPDAEIGYGRGAKYGWLPETVDAWQAARPGRGARTDLKQ